MAFKAHAARDLFGRPAFFEPVLDGCLQLRMNNHLSMDRAALLIFILRDQSVIAIQFWKFGVCVSVPLDVAVDCLGITA
jgi:hypothetical protein